VDISKYDTFRITARCQMRQEVGGCCSHCSSHSLWCWRSSMSRVVRSLRGCCIHGHRGARSDPAPPTPSVPAVTFSTLRGGRREGSPTTPSACVCRCWVARIENIPVNCDCTVVGPELLTSGRGGRAAAPLGGFASPSSPESRLRRQLRAWDLQHRGACESASPCSRLSESIVEAGGALRANVDVIVGRRSGAEGGGAASGLSH